MRKRYISPAPQASVRNGHSAVVATLKRLTETIRAPVVAAGPAAVKPPSRVAVGINPGVVGYSAAKPPSQVFGADLAQTSGPPAVKRPSHVAVGVSPRLTAPHNDASPEGATADAVAVRGRRFTAQPTSASALPRADARGYVRTSLRDGGLSETEPCPTVAAPNDALPPTETISTSVVAPVPQPEEPICSSVALAVKRPSHVAVGVSPRLTAPHNDASPEGATADAVAVRGRRFTAQPTSTPALPRADARGYVRTSLRDEIPSDRDSFHIVSAPTRTSHPTTRMNRRIFHLSPPSQPFRSCRSGVTLVEVLMALMIMSIGVTSVAVLFPISVLRSIQATQLTNAAIVRLNLEVTTDVQPELIFDPDGDYNPTATLAARRAALEEHFRAPASRNYVVDPVGFYTHLDDGNPGFAATFGNDGTNPLGVPRWGGGLKLTNGRGINIGGLSANERTALRLKALAFANQGDGWETQIDAPPGNLVNGGVRLSSDLDLTQVPTSQLVLPPDGNGGYLVEDPELYRIVLFSTTGKFSQAFPLTAIDKSNNTAFFTEDTNGNNALDNLEDVNMNGVLDERTLPAEFGGTVSRVLLQSRKISDYSWMLNVRRRGDGQARSVDVVVRFNDGVAATDERLFEAAFVPSTVSPPSTSRSVWVRLPARSNPGDTTEPSIRKGKFIFDATNGVWYRIQDVQERPTWGTGSGNWANFDYLVTVQEPIRSTDGAGTLAGGGPFAPAMFPTGIVDVYPMGSRNLPDSMQLPTF